MAPRRSRLEPRALKVPSGRRLISGLEQRRRRLGVPLCTDPAGSLSTPKALPFNAASSAGQAGEGISRGCCWVFCPLSCRLSGAGLALAARPLDIQSGSPEAGLRRVPPCLFNSLQTAEGKTPFLPLSPASAGAGTWTGGGSGREAVPVFCSRPWKAVEGRAGGGWLGLWDGETPPPIPPCQAPMVLGSGPVPNPQQSLLSK